MTTTPYIRSRCFHDQKVSVFIVFKPWMISWFVTRTIESSCFSCVCYISVTCILLARYTLFTPMLIQFTLGAIGSIRRGTYISMLQMIRTCIEPQYSSTKPKCQFIRNFVVVYFYNFNQFILLSLYHIQTMTLHRLRGFENTILLHKYVHSTSHDHKYQVDTINFATLTIVIKPWPIATLANPLVIHLLRCSIVPFSTF